MSVPYKTLQKGSHFTIRINNQPAKMIKFDNANARMASDGEWKIMLSTEDVDPKR